MDLTVLYYTSNQIPERFAKFIRDSILEATEDKYPIISVSQKPIDFGENICIGEIGVSPINVYKQILVGAKTAKTKYIACCEDDTLYISEHFKCRPVNNSFLFNQNRWNLHGNVFWIKTNAIGMCECISPRDLMIETLEKRFEKYPNGEGASVWGEPTRYESVMELERPERETLETNDPIINIRHRYGLTGLRIIKKTYRTVEEFPRWGKAIDLWHKVKEMMEE